MFNVFKGRTPLGWLQLLHNKTRFVVAVAGVGFAVVLVFMQLGFMNMLFDTTVMLHKKFDAEVVILSTEAKDMSSLGSFSRRRLAQAMGVAGVADTDALYVSTMSWTKPSNGEKGTIMMLATDPGFKAYKDPLLTAQMPSLNRTGTFLFDRGSRGDYSDFLAKIDLHQEPSVEIAGKRIAPVGTFAFGASFATEAIGITSSQTFMALTPNSDPRVVNVGLIKVADGYEPADIVARLNALGGSEVRAMSMADFITLSRSRLSSDSPIAIIFTFGAIVGLVVGAIIVMQILSSDVQDHLGEYATFKAMGFTNGHLLSVVYEQSVILTIVGFVPAFLISIGLYALVGQLVAMDLTMTLSRAVQVFAMTASMCAIAGTIAMRRVYSADPADVF
jgi:putative ABC transport system permease protein